MFKKMKHMKNEKGLTLVELLAVIVVLAIVAAIAVPSIGNIINNQRDKAILADISGFVSAAKIAYAEGSCTGGGTGNKEVCVFGDVDFKSDKFNITTATANKVDFTTVGITSGPNNPLVIVSLKDENSTSHLPFKGKNKSSLYTTITADTGFTESTLNSLMGN